MTIPVHAPRAKASGPDAPDASATSLTEPDTPRPVRHLRRAGEWFAVLTLAAILIAILVGIVRRYLFGAPLVWIDELVVVLFIWCVFITSALVVRIEDHVAFELVHSALPLQAQRWVSVVAFGGAGLCLLAAAPKSADFILFLSRERTPALQWRLDIVYACFVVFIVAAGLMLVAHAARLARRDERALPGARP